MPFTWTINSETLTLSDPYRIKALSGIGGAPASVQLQKAPYQDGKSYRDTISEERYITIDLLVANNAYTYADILNARRTLVRLFNPKAGVGVFAWEQTETSKTYNLKAYVEKGPEFIDDVNSRLVQRALVYLIAPDPYWYDPTAETIIMVAFEGGWSFHWSFPLGFGAVGKKVTVTNNGDVDTPVLITVTGYTDSPIITNVTTGQIIEVNRGIPAGHTLEIYTGFDAKRIELMNTIGNKTNAFHYLATGTNHSLWQFKPGINEITYTAADEDNSAQTTLEFYHRFSGI